MSRSSWSWSNSSFTSRKIVGRLDRILVNQEWVNLYPNDFAEYLPALSNDHCPQLLNLQKTAPLGPWPFRLLNSLSSKEGFLDTVHQGWNIPVVGNPFFRFVMKLKQVKKILKVKRIDWNVTN